MSKKKPAKTRRDVPAREPAEETAASASHFVMFRETVESIVVAFVLAFLFRTFEAEAFVIPTGSMSPSLQGRHMDVHCAECGYRFRTSASSEDPEDIGPDHNYATASDAEVIGGVCPMCAFPMPFTSDLPQRSREEISELADLDELSTHRSYPGDRILVNKYGFDFHEPQRWDVIVFKFPGDGNMNYIKRLVGMPGEELKIYQGDVFTRPLEGDDQEFRILHKPADKVAAMLQPVHDTDYESATLHRAGWPLRWAATTSDGWTVDAEPGEQTVAQRFTIDAAADAPEAWLRYRHQVPERVDQWLVAASVAEAGSLEALADQAGANVDEAQQAWAEHIHPQLISDFNAYNASLTRRAAIGSGWRALEHYLGLNWVGDLAVEADVEVLEPRGELSLDLVEAGYHFRATINLNDGLAKLTIINGRTGELVEGFQAEAKTSVVGPGSYQLRFANVDDQLLLWVDGELVAFDKSTYDPDQLFAGGRKRMIPWADVDVDGVDQGDLSPAGVAARGAKLEVTRLAVLRDVYYIAASDTLARQDLDTMRMDYPHWRRATTTDDGVAPPLDDSRQLLAEPSAWRRFLNRRAVTFKVDDKQLFAMGDNSPFSQDARLWTYNQPWKGIPGGPYLDRRLLIGKAICVFWPHSWGGIPGLPQLPGFPNFRDMRLVR